MVSLRIKGGTKKEVTKGSVEIEGSCIVLYEAGKNLEKRVAFAYCLLPGEYVTREGDDYIVEF